MALRISLRDGERVVINGAVLRSEGKTVLHADNRCAILRGREVMTPEDVTSPMRALYFHCQMAYIEPQNLLSHQDQILQLLNGLLTTGATTPLVEICVALAGKVAQGDFYRALAECRRLIALEDEAAAETEQHAV